MTPEATTEEPLVQVQVGTVSEPPRLRWAEGGTFSLPSSLASRFDCNGAGPADIVLGPGTLPATPDIVEGLRLRHAYTEQRPASSRLPFSYRRIPGPVRRLVAVLQGRTNRGRLSKAIFPAWPLDLSADFVADLCESQAAPDNDGSTPVVLSHDLDSPEGLENAVKLFIDVEEEFGARSAHYVVPCAWPVDHGLCGELERRGHEIGVHGYDHSNRTPFAPPEERRRRLEAARPFAERYAVQGYRAPSLLRTRALLEDLADFYAYDSSIPTSGGLFPTPGNGCASARLFAIGDLVELPISLPRDGSLRFLGHGPEEILKIWITAAEQVRASGGVVVLLTHCEAGFSGNPAMLSRYRRFLEHLAQAGQYRFVLPKELVQNRNAGR
jgi:peptidoglycan/xylan/chitin deacetylase (PgdA/CDA1 family)